MPPPPRPRLTRADVGAWLIRSSAPVADLGGTVGATGLRLDRCLRPSYRLDLMRPGDPCLLWVSGRDRPGVHALGRLLDVPDRAPDPTVAVELVPLAAPVLRSTWLADAELSAAEVVRMPAGSNPSYLTPPQLSALHRLVPPLRQPEA